MKINQRIYQKGACALAAVALAVTGAGCKLGSSSDGAQPQGSAVPADPGPGAGNEVVRYAGLEVNDAGQRQGVRQSVAARSGADWNSPVVATLYPGTVVTRVAHYSNYSLVSWSGLGGQQQGWVDTNLAFNGVVRWDASGVAAPVGIVPPPPVVTTPPPPAVTTTPPPPVTVPPTVAPPPTLTAPPPVKTVTPPPTKPTATTTGKIFKPPVIH